MGRVNASARRVNYKRSKDFMEGGKRRLAGNLRAAPAPMKRHDGRVQMTDWTTKRPLSSDFKLKCIEPVRHQQISRPPGSNWMIVGGQVTSHTKLRNVRSHL